MVAWVSVTLAFAHYWECVATVLVQNFGISHMLSCHPKGYQQSNNWDNDAAMTVLVLGVLYSVSVFVAPLCNFHIVENFLGIVMAAGR